MSSNSNSLQEVYESVNPSEKKGKLKRVFAFFGPAYLVSVGYMDPGNWATDIAGGSQFGYKLIWVLLMSNIMAVVLQSLSARLGIVRGRDLAQASRETYPKGINFLLYILAEIAIIATDLAEVVGMAIGLELLFDIPLLMGVCITTLDSILILFLMNKGIRKLEAFIIGLIALIGICFFIQVLIADPNYSDVITGFIPAIPNRDALYIAIGIIGATVMPHNLYLHSSLVQTRKIKRDFSSIKKALRYNLFDSIIALNLAFFVNAAILILAASSFYENGLFNIAEIQDAYKLLEPLLGSKWAPKLFAIALILAGQSSTITGTLSGQIVMEGYLNLRIQPWVRRLITRLLAVIPALITVIIFGESKTAELLILSQVILSLQLGFAIIPLIHFVSNKTQMKKFVINLKTKVIAWIIAGIIVYLNIELVYKTIYDWLSSYQGHWVFPLIIILICVFFMILLLYIIIQPFFNFLNSFRTVKSPYLIPHGKPIVISTEKFNIKHKNIAIALDFSENIEKGIATALKLGDINTIYTFIHIVETPNAFIYGSKSNDLESFHDKKMLENYAQQIRDKGYLINTHIGFGSPSNSIASFINNSENIFDLLIMPSHGHNRFKRIIFGTTVEKVRRKINIPVLIC